MTSPITPSQIRAGRALVAWSQDELATKAGVGLSTVRDYENERRTGDLVSGLGSISRALEEAGVVFLASEGDLGPGARIRARRPNVLRRPHKVGRFDELIVVVEWRGKEYSLLLSHELMSDFGNFTNSPSEDEYLKILEKKRGRILDVAATAIDAGRATPDRRVWLSAADFTRQDFI
jgi:hypothetical protein